MAPARTGSRVMENQPGEVVAVNANRRDGDIAPLPSLERAREFARQSKAENTLRGYRGDWKNFCGWCGARELSPLPASPETVAAYIADCAGHLKVGSIQRRLNAIAEAHKAVGLESPTRHATVTNTMKGIRRLKGTAPTQRTARSARTG